MKVAAPPKASGATVDAAAARLKAASDNREPCAPLTDLLESGDLAAAYEVQEIATQGAIAAGRRLVGRKIGLTSPAVQRQLGVSQPDYGALFSDMAILDGWEVPADLLIQPKVEAEVAFVLEADLDQEQLTIADILRAIAFALPAIEIVDSRIADWKIAITDTIADNASAGLFVLGSTPKKLSDLDLRLCGMVMEQGGDEVSVGAGAACLGNPLSATLWLAQTMARLGQPLKSGDILLSGALGPMVTVKRGEVYEARISGLGSVRAAFARESV